MSLRTSATRYAKALLHVALAESDAAQVERDLTTIAEAMASHEDLRRVLTSPGTPHSARMGVLQAVTARAGVQPPVAKLLAMLAERNRLELVPELRNVYRERLLAHRNIVRAAVTSAVALSPEKVQALAERLSRATGKQVQLETTVDDSLVGGVVTRLGSVVYDGSVRTQLAKMRQQLVNDV
jgi:F-type H+-transporting ATPase subunit delta